MVLEIKHSKNANGSWSTGGTVALIIISLIIGAALFGVSYIGMKNSTYLGHFNQPILDWVLSHRFDQVTDAMKIITSIVDPSFFIFAILAFSILWAIIKRELWRPFILLSANFTISVLSKIIKKVTENARPPQNNMITPIETDFSFISTHVANVTILCLMIGYLICSRNSNVKGFIFWTISTILAVGAMTASRLYLGYHWLTDTVGAIGFSLIIFALFMIIDQIFLKITKR